MVLKVGINGFGRVGRVVFRTCMQQTDIEVVAINDPAIAVDYICYLMKFDSTHGRLNGEISSSGDIIFINGKSIKLFNQKVPNNIPWHSVGVDYVIEASGMFSNLEKSSGHLVSEGVRRVIVTAPSVDVPMIILGVNDVKLSTEQRVVSCGSSTLYCLAPIMKVLQDKFGVEDAFVTSIHAMTPSLKPLDGLCLRGKHWRDHRSITQNIIPATTSACKALGKIIPAMKDKMAGLAFRVPIVNVSVLDITVRLTKETTIEDIIEVVDEHSKNSLHNILKMSNEDAVSSDFAEDSHSCILDINSSLSLKPDYYKLICWYENEFSYACRVVDLIYFSEKQYNNKIPPRFFIKHTVQQTELSIKRPGLQGSEKYPPKLVSSTSKTIDVKMKNTRPTLRKHFTQSLSLHSTSNPRVPKKKAELFKVWKDDTETLPIARQNRNTFFQSCITLGNNSKTNAKECIKAQERLEKVKLEFSKMVNITEELLKKSYINKNNINNINSQANSSKGNKSDTTAENKETDNVNNKIASVKPNDLEEAKVLDVKCDVKKTSESTINSKTICGVDSRNSYEKDMSEYSVSIGCAQTLLKQCNVLTKSTIGRNIQDLTNVKVQTNNPPIEEISDNMNELKEKITKTVDTIMGGLTQKIIIPRFRCKTIEESQNNAERIDNTGIGDNEKYFNENVGFNLKENIFSRHRSKIGINEKLPRLLEGINCLSSKLSNELNKNIIDVSRIDKALKKHNIVLINYIQGEDAAIGYKNQGNKTIENQEIINTINVEKNDEEKLIQNTTTGKCFENMEDIEIDSKDYSSNSSNTQKSSDDNIEKYESVNTFHKDEERMIYVCDKQKDDQHSNSFKHEMSLMSSNLTLECNSLCSSPTKNNASKLDIYDKLDSASITDSESSLQIDGRKSQVIDIKDLTNSLEDLARLDKICRIIEISDELSDKLFAPIANDKDTQMKARKKWSFKDLCEKINLDEFCNKVFSSTSPPTAIS